jgi:hypothetical protein
MDGMPWIAMAEVILDEPQIVAFVSEGKSTGMTEHVRMYRCQPRPRSGSGDKVVHGLPSEWLAAFGKEQPGQRVLTAREVPSKGTKFIASDWLLDRILGALVPVRCTVWEGSDGTLYISPFQDRQGARPHHPGNAERGRDRCARSRMARMSSPVIVGAAGAFAARFKCRRVIFS